MSNNLIYLVGFMGSGKSYWGKRIAEALKMDFIDLDDYLEEKAGQTISNIFEKEGEGYFRNLEKVCLEEVSLLENTIISLGGGTPCFFDNMETINETGISIFLKTSVETIIERLKNETNHRPLLKEKSQEELKSFIQDKLKIRSHFYEKSQFIVNTESENVLNLVREINKTRT